ncbi:hypothetical protein [Butyrivibrio sp. AE2015]|uniref:hypothetical protein n=1 Tax=Butyrivibrio sp. AE2015 TaxID=1280663 RepID=UPI0003B2F298|nr:hypothetical protein [Butyrivibrio sp. AE2015]
MRKKFNINSFWELALVAGIASALVLTIVIGFGTMFTGWHLVDDHQFFWYITRMNEGESVLDIIKSELLRDHFEQRRARFLFYPLRVPQAYLFGFNIVPYYILKAVEAILSLIFLYYIGRELDLNYFYSALFSLSAFCGHQSSVWWKLGTPQLQGTVFFSMGFYLMLRYFKTNSRAFAISSFVAFLCMANFHESFLCLIPFVILFTMFYAYKEGNYDGKFSLSILWEIVKKRLAYEIAIGSVFLVLISYIVFVLGVNSYGSVELGYPLSDTIHNFIDSIHGDLMFFWYFGVLLLFILATYYNAMKKLWMEAIMLIAIILPQLFLYQKEGFYGRYLLPLSFAWSFLFVVIPYGYGVLKTKGRRVVYTITLCAMVAFSIRTVALDADYFRFRGDSVQAMLDELLELKKDGADVVSTLSATNYEAGLTTDYWLSSHNTPDCMYWNWEAGEVVGNPDYDITKADMIIEYNRDDIHFRADMDNIDHSGFEYVRCGSLDLYFSKAVYDTFSEEDLAKFKIEPTIYGIGAYDYN